MEEKNEKDGTNSSMSVISDKKAQGGTSPTSPITKAAKKLQSKLKRKNLNAHARNSKGKLLQERLSDSERINQNLNPTINSNRSISKQQIIKSQLPNNIKKNEMAPESIKQ